MEYHLLEESYSRKFDMLWLLTFMVRRRSRVYELNAAADALAASWVQQYQLYKRSVEKHYLKKLMVEIRVHLGQRHVADTIS